MCLNALGTATGVGHSDASGARRQLQGRSPCCDHFPSLCSWFWPSDGTKPAACGARPIRRCRWPPPNAPSPPPERIAPAVKGDLSNRLARQNGTITPPNVDPGMTVTPPPRAGASDTGYSAAGVSGGNPSLCAK